MKEYYECPYCGEIFTKYGIGPHIWRMHTKEGRKHNDKRRRKKQYNFVCPKCGKKHSKFLLKSDARILKGYCSYLCSNSRVHSKKTKDKISKSMKKLKPIQCELCEEWFVPKRSNQKYCGIQCAYAGSRFKLIMSNKTRDASEISKKAYRNGRKLTGGKTKWIEYKNIKVQGTYELRVCYILDVWKKSGKIKDWEYTKDRFQYIGVDNKEHTYLLDFKVFVEPEIFYYVEVKGRELENDKQKWKVVRDSGYKLEVWRLKDIEKKEKGLWCNLVSIGALGASDSCSNQGRPTISEIREKGELLLLAGVV